MKKICVILLAIIYLMMPNLLYAKEKTKIYVFTKEKEEVSLKLLSYLDELKKEYDFEYIEYQVWDKDWKENSEMRELADAVADKYKSKIIGAPVYIIGDHYYDEYIETMNNDIRAAIEETVDDNKYVDVIEIVKKDIQQKKKINQ